MNNFAHALTPLFTSIFFLGMAIVSIFLSKNEIKRLFAVFCLLTFHWQFSWFVQFLLNDPKYADLIVRIGYSGIIFLPIAFYDCVFVYLKIQIPKVRYLLYGTGVIFLVALWFSKFFIKGFHKYYFGYYPEAGPLHLVYIIIVTVMMYSIYRRFKTDNDLIIKSQAKIIKIAVIIYCLAAIDYVLNYPQLVDFIHIPLYPIGVFFNMISMLIFILSHFVALNLSLEKRVDEKTKELKESFERLQKSEELKKQFISNIAHDLKTPLSIITGHATLLENNPNLDEQELEYISFINHSAAGISHMIDRLISVSFIEEEETPILENFEYNRFIHDFVSSFEEIIHKQEKILNISQIPINNISIVKIDSNWLERIVGNLIHNALKYSNKNASITVRITQDTNNIYTEITDTGIGIEKERLPHIFERKFKYDKVSQDSQSMGLGLFIVKEYLNKMGGKIDVFSEKDKGTTFLFSLPLHLDQTAAAKNFFVGDDRRTGRDRRLKNERRQTDRIKNIQNFISRDLQKVDINTDLYENRNLSKSTILIVEDSPGQLHLIIESLKEYFNLVFARNGLAGLEKFQQYKEKIALVLSDVKMPEMDGFEFCKKIFEDKSNEHIPFVFITAYFNREEEFQGIHIGASDYIQKPINVYVLREKINHWISRRHYETMMEELNDTLEDKIMQISKLQDIISHEIRNPLHVMKGSVYFINKLKDRLPKNDPETQKIFSKIETLSLGVESLISVLDLNKQITEGGTMFDSSLHSLQNLMDEVLAMTSHLLYNTDIRLNRVQDFPLLCNRRMLIQVFVNLIRNAAEAIKERNPERGHIDINMIPLDNNQIEIKISDNGTGMNEETQKNLFKFKYTTKKNGTGIGLHFSKMIIKMHNGTISFNSRINEGTLFRIILPIKTNEAALPHRKD